MSSPDSPDDRRNAPRDGDRRRQQWHSFRNAYPAFLRVIAVLFLLLVAGDMWLAYRRYTYANEIAALRSQMTDAERKKSDIVVQSEQDKVRLALELAKHQSHLDSHLHLSIAVDSGLMYLERDGALLRVMRVALAPARVPAVRGDTANATLPRGERTVQQVIAGDAPALVLNGDARIYAGAATDAVAAGNIRVNTADMLAILPNVSAGMPVYFY